MKNKTNIFMFIQCFTSFWLLTKAYRANIGLFFFPLYPDCSVLSSLPLLYLFHKTDSTHLALPQLYVHECVRIERGSCSYQHQMNTEVDFTTTGKVESRKRWALFSSERSSVRDLATSCSQLDHTDTQNKSSDDKSLRKLHLYCTWNENCSLARAHSRTHMRLSATE